MIKENNQLLGCRYHLDVLLILSLLFAAVDDSHGADTLPFNLDAESTKESTGRPGERRLPQPGFSSDLPSPEFTLPPLKLPPPEEAPLSTQVQVFVRSFRIQNNTVLSEEELKKTLEPYIGRVVSTADLQELRHQLTLMYIEKGYITSGVIIPDQNVTDGTIVLRVIESVLSEVGIQGERNLNPDYIRNRIRVTDQDPLNISELQEQLQLLQLDPNIERLNAQLTPGDQLGESVLKLDVEESRPYQLAFRINNHRSPSIGEIQGEIHALYRNLAGRGDAFNLLYQKTEGLDEGTVAFSIPLRAQGPTLNLGYRRGESEVVEKPFNDIDVESDFDEWSLSLKHPIIERLHRSFDVTLSLEKRRSQTFLFGDPFPFSPGVEDNGESKVTVIRLIGDWLERWEDQVIAFRTSLSKGIDAFDATINKQGPDGRFLTWLGQFQYARRFGNNNNELIFRTDLQLAADELLPLEKFSVGGAHSVRGYRENELVRDNGWVSSIELRTPLLQNIPKIGKLQLAAFADYGQSWNKSGNTPDPRSISSVGLGLRWDPSPGWQATLYAAIPFRNVEHAEHDLQDSGIHFEISYQAF